MIEATYNNTDFETPGSLAAFSPPLPQQMYCVTAANAPSAHGQSDTHARPWKPGHLSDVHAEQQYTWWRPHTFVKTSHDDREGSCLSR